MQQYKTKNIKIKLDNLVNSKGLPQSTLQHEYKLLDLSDIELLSYGMKCRGIDGDPRLNKHGKREDIEKEKSKMMISQNRIDNIVNNIHSGMEGIKGKIVNAKHVALGKNRVLDTNQQLMEYLQMQEIRQSIAYQQPITEAEHAKGLAGQRKLNLSISDEERIPPNVAKSTVFRALKGFDNPVNRLIVRAVIDAPVPILDDESMQELNKALEQTVASDELMLLAQAECRLEALNILKYGLKDIIQNPLAISSIEEHQPRQLRPDNPGVTLPPVNLPASSGPPQND